jgi:hypothetical protein
MALSELVPGELRAAVSGAETLPDVGRLRAEPVGLVVRNSEMLCTFSRILVRRAAAPR